MKPRLFAFIILILGLLGGWSFVNRVEIKQDISDWQRKRDLPPAMVVYQEDIKDIDNEIASVAPARHASPGEAGRSLPRNDVKELPLEINLAVPFISQAPYAVWDALHKEACEEAAVIMLNGFYQGKKKIDKEAAELAIQKLVAWEKEKFGYFEDTTAAEVVIILKEHFGLSSARAVYDISVEDIKKELAAGRPVLVPTAGRLLGNPYYHQPGPLYHMLVIKGFTKDGRFITNDAGTRWGADYAYKFEVLFNAIHDWVPGGDILTGRKAMIKAAP